jgi:hypothetical protein
MISLSKLLIEAALFGFIAGLIVAVIIVLIKKR